MTTFVSELKRRNVFRVAAAYAVVAWIIIEAGSVLLPTFGASESAFQIYVLVVIAGFLVSLVFAWVFEVTPEGVKLEKNVVREESITSKTGSNPAAACWPSAARSERFCNQHLRKMIREADWEEIRAAFARKGKYVVMSIDLNKIISEVVSLLKHTIDKQIIISKNLTPSTTSLFFLRRP